MSVLVVFLSPHLFFPTCPALAIIACHLEAKSKQNVLALVICQQGTECEHGMQTDELCEPAGWLKKCGGST